MQGGTITQTPFFTSTLDKKLWSTLHFALFTGKINCGQPHTSHYLQVKFLDVRNNSRAYVWSGYADDDEIPLLPWIESRSSILQLVAKGILISTEPHHREIKILFLLLITSSIKIITILGLSIKPLYELCWTQIFLQFT